MEADAIKAKLSGFGMQILEGIDPDPENYVCAGIIYTRSMNIGVLSRLEPNKQAMVRRTFICIKKNPSNHLTFLIVPLQ